MIFGLALIARIGFVLWYPQVTVEGDAGAYDFEGYQLASGAHSGLEAIEIAKGPVYPIFLAGLYRFFGHNPQAVRVVQAILSFLALILLYALASNVFDRDLALIALLLASIYPPFISYPGLLLTETLSIFLILAFVYLLIKGLARRDFALLIAAGAVGGVMVLNRVELLVMVIACALVVWRAAGRLRAGTLLLAAVLIMLPWALRNYRVYHKFILVSPQAGEVLWISTYEKNWISWHGEDTRFKAVVAGLDSLEAQRAMQREGFKNILSHPLIYLKFCIRRIPRFWIGGHSDTFAGLEQTTSFYLHKGEFQKIAVKLFMLSYNLCITVLGFLGLFLAWKLAMTDSAHLILLSLPVIVKALIHFFLFANLRFQVPIMSFVIIFAAFTIMHLRRIFRDLIPVYVVGVSHPKVSLTEPRRVNSKLV